MKFEFSIGGQNGSGVGAFVARTIILTLAIIIAIRLLPGVRIVDGSVATAFVTALVISLLDNFIRPVLIFISLPFMVVTLGLFIFVINAIVIQMTAGIVPKFEVDGFGYALLLNLVVTVLNYLLELPRRWLNRSTYQPTDTADGGFTDYEEVEESDNYEYHDTTDNKNE